MHITHLVRRCGTDVEEDQDEAPLHESPKSIGDWGRHWSKCSHQFRCWRIPPRWSARDWWDEVQAVGLAAAWQACCDFDPARGFVLESFVRGRIRSCVLTRYRQEWSYGLHCDPKIGTE